MSVMKTGRRENRMRGGERDGGLGKEQETEREIGLIEYE